MMAAAMSQQVFFLSFVRRRDISKIFGSDISSHVPHAIVAVSESVMMKSRWSSHSYYCDNNYNIVIFTRSNKNDNIIIYYKIKRFEINTITTVLY